MSNRIRLAKIKKVVGFVAEDAGIGEETVKVLSRCFVHSDQKDFYEYVDGISSNFLSPNNFLIDNINRFLILLHKDLSADIIVNDITTIATIIGKRDMIAGEKVKSKHIADITELRFEGIEIKNTDCVIYCFKKGWKFGLYFDFTPMVVEGSVIDVDRLYAEFALHLKYLTFQSEYAVLENDQLFNELFNDGWFPFIRLLGGEYKELSKIYEKRTNLTTEIGAFLEKYDQDKISDFTTNWWRKDIFANKREIIEAGISSYLQNSKSGFIACIKILYSEIEGILRISYFKEHNKKPTFRELTDYIDQKAKSKFFSRHSLGFPYVFFHYLSNVIFKGFDLETGQVDLSRHSTSHGVANPEDYTKMKALQAILVLDQIYYFL